MYTDPAGTAVGQIFCNQNETEGLWEFHSLLVLALWLSIYYLTLGPKLAFAKKV